MTTQRHPGFHRRANAKRHPSQVARILAGERDDPQAKERIRHLLVCRQLERAIAAEYPAGVDDPALLAELEALPAAAGCTIRYTRAPSLSGSRESAAQADQALAAGLPSPQGTPPRPPSPGSAG